MRLTRAGIASLALIAALAGCKPSAKQTGYFKSDARDRVIAYHSEAALGEADARAILDAAPATAGRVTAILIYEGRASGPGDRLTTSADLTAALRLVGSPPYDNWTWRLRINPAGQRTYD